MTSASPPGALAERREGRALLWLGSLLFLLFALLPLAALLAAALPGRPLRYLADPMLQQALRVSAVTSLISTSLVVLTGLPVAYLLARFRFRGREVLDTLIDLPMTLPPVVAGVALLLAFGRAGWIGQHLDALLNALLRREVHVPLSTTAVVLAQAFMSAPFFIRSARAGFEAVPMGYEHAAMTLGRNRWGVFWSVSVPLASPALLAGVVLAWARAISEFGATLIFAGSLPGVTQTLPLAVMGAMEIDLDLAIALSVLSLVLAFGALVGTKLVLRGGRL
jgi:molybdate transport system permease protein